MSSASHETDTDRSDEDGRAPRTGPAAVFPLGLFVVAEVLCTATLAAWFLL